MLNSLKCKITKIYSTLTYNGKIILYVPDIVAANFALTKICCYSRSKSWNKTRPRGADWIASKHFVRVKYSHAPYVRTHCFELSTLLHFSVYNVYSCLMDKFCVIIDTFLRVKIFLTNQYPGESVVAQQVHFIGRRKSHSAIFSSIASCTRPRALLISIYYTHASTQHFVIVYEWKFKL